MHVEPKTKLGRVVNNIEETLIALILGLMTIVTFANVVARALDSNILWALETTVYLFAWLVLIGASYCVKTRAHLGVDVVLNIVSPGVRRLLAIFSISACLAFSVLLLIGSWNYWAPFAALPQLDGTVRDQAFYIVDDIPMPEFLRFLEDAINQGETYDKLPKLIPYVALPIGVLLLNIRFLQLAWQILTGEADRIITSHEAEDLVEEAAAKADKEG